MEVGLSAFRALNSYEKAIINDSDAAVSEEIDIKLWKNGIYPQIDRLRKQIASSTDVHEKKQLSGQLDSIILANLGRIDGLIELLPENSPKRILFKLYLYSGDLRKEQGFWLSHYS